jgi:glucose/arabinose dehydrogenase
MPDLSRPRLPALSLGAALALLLTPAPASAADSVPPAENPARGRVLFQQSCGLCHATGQDAQPTSGQGPLLAGVVGRRAASLPNFGYSKALTDSGLIWDAATLDRFLAAPGSLVPGTTMVVAVPNPVDRGDLVAFLATLRAPARSAAAAESTGPAAHPRTAGDWQNDAPGRVHRIRVADLPPPFATASAGNAPKVVDRPAGARLSVPPGFAVTLLASGLDGPRLLRAAPNGDIFVAETRRGRVRVLRLAEGGAGLAENAVFAGDLNGPFGIAFYPLGENPQWIYVGELNSVVRIPYRSGDLRARGLPEVVVPQLAATTGGHTTRDVAFSLDGRRMFVSIGSGSNVGVGMPAKTPDEIRAWEASHARGSAWGYEADRAEIAQTDPEGRRPLRIFASGVRNAVGLAVQPATGELWASTNERDALGDDLVPDYITHVREGGFYGWPWYYLGRHEDPRHPGARPDLAGEVIVPDVPVQAHSASLELTFYPLKADGVAAFPREYRGDIFAAFHGSWNRTGRTGTKVVRVRLKDGVATGEYEDFLTGFVIDDGHVWGRPVGVTVAADGALLVTDDGNGTLWRVAYRGR